jgi:hypothetical protein
MFADWQGLPALQAGASLETYFYFRRKLKPTPSVVEPETCNPAGVVGEGGALFY